MASWSDKIPQFNPYVQQLPVEDMVKVGMQKQQMYNEGVQKIQTQIDNVAGLDIMKDVSKKYLQSKLDQLGNDLKTVAAGDFSNFQLVNSTAGMATQIAKDEYIQTAVSSTAKIKKEQAKLEQAKKEGKSAPANELAFSKTVNKYLNNEDLAQSYSGAYDPYTDYKKNAIEVVKALVKNENIKDVAFEYDKNGKVTGILDAVNRTKIAGVTPERVQQALLVGLSPSDFKQMQMDGIYNYSNKTTEEFVSDLKKGHDTDYQTLAKQKEIVANSINSTTSAEEKIRIQNQIAELDKQMTAVDRDYNNITKLIVDGDSDAAKAQFHTVNWMNGFAQTFSSSDIAQTVETNPYVQPAQFRESQAQDWKKFTAEFGQRERFHRDDNYYKQLAHNLAASKEAREAKKDEMEAMYGSVPVTVDQSGVPTVTLDNIVGHINEQQTYLNAEKNEIMKTFKRKGDDKWLSQQEAAWKSGKAVDPLLSDYFNRVSDIQTDKNANEQMMLNITKQADSKYGNVNNYIPAGTKSLVLTSKTGKSTFTPQEVTQFNEKVNRYIKTSSVSVGVGGVSSSTSYDIENAKKNLSPKEFYLFTLTMKKNEKGAKSLLPSESALLNYSDHLQKTVNSKYRKVFNEKEKFINSEIKQRVTAMQGTASSVPLSNEFQKTSFGNALLGFADNAEKQGGIANSPDVTAADIRGIAADINNATFTVVEGTPYQPAMYELNATNKKGDNVRFRVTPEQKAAVFGNRFDASPAILAARPYLNQMTRNNSNTTSLDGGPTTISNSFINKTRFPKVKHYGVSGNVVNQNGGYSVRINLTDPHTGKVLVEDLPYPAGGLIDEDKIAVALQNLSDSEIFQMLHNRPATAADLQKLKQASKKP